MRNYYLYCLLTLVSLTGFISAKAQFPAPYCAEVFPSGVEPITSVVFAGINNTSPAALGGAPHDNFTAISGNVLMGQTYTISVQGNTGGNWTTHVRLFVDWNNDGDFVDAGETFTVGTIVNSSGTDGITATASIDIPVTATPGNLRMRVSKRFSAAPTPCNTTGFGQAEDYTLIVTPPTPCAGLPNAGTATATPSPVCLGENISLSVTGATLASGLVYQWEVSTTSNSTGFNPVTGATSLSATTTQSVSSWYRLRVTCTNTNDISYSNPVQVVSPPAPNGLYTIGAGPTTWNIPAGVGNASGTNFATFQEAIAAMSCGISASVTFNVVNATYNTQVIIPFIRNTADNRTVTFNGNGSTLTFATTAAERAVIKLNGANFIRINDFIINPTGTNAYGIQLINDADSNIIRNNTINLSLTSTANTVAGIVMSGSATDAIGTGTTTALHSFNEIRNNTINGGFYGITLTATPAGGANINNTIYGNTIRDFHQYGIYIAGSGNTVIDSNQISRPNRTVTATTVEGIYFTTQSNNARITRNRITNPFGGLAARATATFNGISFNSASASAGNDNIVSNNLIGNINNSNGPVNATLNNSSNSVSYFHNTISLDDVASAAGGTTRGMSVTGSSDGIILYNNMISITRGGNGQKHGIYAGGTPLLGSDYNNVYVNATNGHFGFSGGNRTTLQNWQTATNLDASSYSFNPVFLSPATGDFCSANAGINDKGLYIGIDNDINNNVRSFTTPDIGAFECTPPPCTIPVVTGTTAVTPTTVCEGLPVLLNLDITAFGSGQTFQWQWSPDNVQPYVNLGDPKQTPDTTIYPVNTMWVRAMVSCATATEYTTPVLLTVSQAFDAGFYTIDNTQSTNYVPGLPGGNFNSFNDAYNAMAACGILGPVVFDVLGNSPYAERLKMDSIRGVSDINTITFNGNGRVITFGAAAPHLPTSADRAVIKLTRLDHTTFNNLVIDASNGVNWGYGVQLHNNADSNTFRNCTIITSTTINTNSYNGVVINATDAGPISTGATFCDGNRFEGNTITGGFYGVALVGGTAASQTIENNRFLSNTVEDFYSTGFYIQGTTNTIIDSNTITRPTRQTLTAVTGILSTTTANNGLIISRNRIRNLTGGTPASTFQQYGIHHNNTDQAGSAASIVMNNLISDMGGNGIMYGLYNVGSDNVHYYHNTVSLDSTNSTATGATRGYFQQSVATGLEFKNNTITIKRGGTGLKHAIYFDNTTLDIVSNYNNFYVNASNAHIGFWTANRTLLADWQTASSEDANSISEDPLYQNPAAADYRPSIQTVDNLGTTVTSVPVTIDILGVPRTATPDMGAFEFNAVACVNPPVAGTASVTPSSNICLQDPIVLDVTGHSPLGTLTFEWFNGPSSTGPWTSISPVQFGPQFNTITSTNEWYRAAVTCNGNTVYTNAVQVVLNPIVLAGTHTINPALPTSTPPWLPGSNFNSFQAAVDAMNCGIGGRVVFNVASGTYNEQIRIGNIRNTSNVNTVTFQSATGNPADVNLTYASTLAATNYTLKLDSASYFRFYNITITATDPVFGRAVEFAGRASFDSIANCNIVAPVVASTSNNATGIYSTSLRGSSNVIKGNNITNGAMGIYWFGTNGANPSLDHQIDSNTISGAYFYGIQTQFQHNIIVRKNIVNVTAPLSATSYGIRLTDCDSTYDVLSNTVNIDNTTTNVYGLYLDNNDRAVGGRALIHGNTVTAATGNTGGIWGLYISNGAAATAHHEVINNVFSINTNGTTAYGIYSNNVSNGRYYNNSVNNISPNGTVTNAAARFENSSAVNLDVRNNIFSHKGGGRALYVQNSNNPQMLNYNMLYTSGAVLVQRTNPAGSYAILDAWVNASNNDKWSIVYEPAFVSNTSLQPNIANPDVWAMHGRGTQITGNSFDFNNAYRPQTLTEGVPDLGAYEFFPTAQPTVLTATPATPAANITQTFMYGTDTVMKITWGATDFPTNITAQRFSGVEPGNRPYPSTTDSMFFYTKVNVGTVPNNYKFDMKLFYLDPWQGSIPNQYQIGLGRRSGDGSAWVVGFSSRVNTIERTITQPDISGNLDRFTGFINPYAPPVLPDKDSSNRGRRFWVAYPVNQLNGSQDMVLYLSARENEDALVTIKIGGLIWKTYSVPGGTVRVSDIVPKTPADPFNAFINTPGLFDKGISIESDVPIVAYAHVYGSASSGAVMLLPVGVWGYEYKTLGITQDYGANSFAYFYVIADNDNTVVEITPTVAVQNPGMTAGTTTTITLNKGQVFQVVASSQTAELTGSVVKSIPNSDGKCFPIATFSGSSRTALDCPTGGASGGDFMMQQNFPATAWGKRYLTAPTSSSTSATQLQVNVYRVVYKDPTTAITVNGFPIATAPYNVTSNATLSYYQFYTSQPLYIQADKPIMVAQYLADGGCPGTGVGDPEMIYISPIEQGIEEVGFYRNTLQNITTNYVTLIVPDAGLASLVVKDALIPQNPDHTYPHPALAGYTVWIKRFTAAQRQVTAESDLPFTGITYGLGSVESYGYNVGTLVKNIQALGNPVVPPAPGNPNPTTEYTCANTPFNWITFLPVIPTSLTWKFSNVPNLSPNADVVITAPTPTGTRLINGTLYYEFALTGNYVFTNTGLFPVVVEYEHPDIESCDNKGSDIIYVQVVPSPKANFSISFSGCEGDNAVFTADLQTANGVNITSWDWTFPGGSTATGQISNFTFSTAGTYSVNLHSVTPDGCMGDSLKQVVVNPRPSVAVVTNLINVCPGDNATFNIQSPLAGASYSWYTTPTGGTPLTNGTGFIINANGTSFTVVNATATATYYVEGLSADGCNSTSRQAVQVQFLPPLPAPVVTVSDITVNTITFSWNAIAGAAGYQVSLNGGTTWVNPSSGATGLTHIVSGLAPATEQCIMVRVLGVNACQNNQSASVCGRTRPDAIFIPNTFTPNGDGRNDALVAYGWAIQSIQFMVFNQWGEKIHEITATTQDANGGFMVWDGKYQGKVQPVGVYAYVAKITQKDGTIVQRSGPLNIVR